jgi:hypothetical protein
MVSIAATSGLLRDGCLPLPVESRVALIAFVTSVLPGRTLCILASSHLLGVLRTHRAGATQSSSLSGLNPQFSLHSQTIIFLSHFYLHRPASSRALPVVICARMGTVHPSCSHGINLLQNSVSKGTELVMWMSSQRWRFSYHWM